MRKTNKCIHFHTKYKKMTRDIVDALNEISVLIDSAARLLEELEECASEELSGFEFDADSAGLYHISAQFDACAGAFSNEEDSEDEDY